MKSLCGLLLVSSLTVCLTSSGQTTFNDEQSIAKILREVLTRQQDAWNRGDLEAFMEGYWKSDSLQFIGSSIRHGWKATLEGYKKGYPSRETMGTLTFDIWQVRPLDAGTWLVSGKYSLARKSDNPQGPFTLLFQKKNGRWVIIYDHTS